MQHVLSAGKFTAQLLMSGLSLLLVYFKLVAQEVGRSSGNIQHVSESEVHMYADCLPNQLVNTVTNSAILPPNPTSSDGILAARPARVTRGCWHFSTVSRDSPHCELRAKTFRDLRRISLQ